LRVGRHKLSAIVTDNLGASSLHPPIDFIVTRAVSAPITLQILHIGDVEAGISALDDAPNLSSVLAALKSDFPTTTLALSAGNNYIPGPFFTASADPDLPYNGIKGRGDIAILN